MLRLLGTGNGKALKTHRLVRRSQMLCFLSANTRSISTAPVVLFICCSTQISISYSWLPGQFAYGTASARHLPPSWAHQQSTRKLFILGLQFVSCRFAASADVKSRRWPPISIQRRPPGTHSKLMRSDVAENWKPPLDDDPPEDTS